MIAPPDKNYTLLRGLRVPSAWRGGFRGAWLRGFLAWDINPVTRGKCPYVNDGRTFSTAYWRAWHNGYDAARLGTWKV